MCEAKQTAQSAVYVCRGSGCLYGALKQYSTWLLKHCYRHLYNTSIFPCDLYMYVGMYIWQYEAHVRGVCVHTVGYLSIYVHTCVHACFVHCTQNWTAPHLYKWELANDILYACTFHVCMEVWAWKTSDWLHDWILTGASFGWSCNFTESASFCIKYCIWNLLQIFKGHCIHHNNIIHS